MREIREVDDPARFRPDQAESTSEAVWAIVMFLPVAIVALAWWAILFPIRLLFIPFKRVFPGD